MLARLIRGECHYHYLSYIILHEKSDHKNIDKDISGKQNYE